MRMTYLVHIVAGTLGLLAGYVALYAAKGGRLHRKSGMLFVWTMLTMALFGMTIAVVRGIAPAINVPAALLTSSMSITALTTVRPLTFGSRWLASLGDLRLMRSGPLNGARRLARHLWRMCFALFVAALSASVQFVKMVPEEYRIRSLFVLPVLAVLVTMFYWLWRIRIRRRLQGIVGVIAPEPV